MAGQKRKQYPCKVCGSRQGQLQRLRYHYWLAHKDIALVALRRGLLDQGDQSMLTPQEERLETLKGKCRTTEGNYRCLLCPTIYGTLDPILTHLSVFHFWRCLSEKNGIGEGGGPFRCSICSRTGRDKAFLSKRSLVAHYGAWHGQVVQLALEGKGEQSRRIADEEDGCGQDAVSDAGNINPYPFPTSVVVLERLEVAEVPAPAAGTAEERLNIVRNLCHRYNRDLRVIPIREGASFKCFWCPLCDRVQSSMGGLLEHLCCLHLQKDIAERRKEEMEEKRCHECNLAFSSRYNARIHFGIQHGELAGPFMELPRIKALAAKQQQQHKRTFQ